MANYWLVRMRYGSGGRGFEKELWQQGLVGVMYGSWSIDDVRGPNGSVERELLTAAAIMTRNPGQPNWFNDKALKYPRRLFLDVREGDRAVVAFDGTINIGVIGAECVNGPSYDGEIFKCRRVRNRRSFALSKLPSVYRLIPSTGRGAVERISAYETLAKMLDESSSEEALGERMSLLSTREFMATLSAEQWEAVCAEYLRGTVPGFRTLSLLVGRSLPDVDIVGVDAQHRRVLAQCKNDSGLWSAAAVRNWTVSLGVSASDRRFFFNRGGFDGSLEGDCCTLVDGEQVVSWLERDPGYLRALKTM